MNVFCFTGNLSNEAEQRFTQGGESIVNFNVAVKSGFGDKATTTWVRCAMWGKRGSAVLPYLTKGQMVGVSGELSSREYEKDGQKRTSLEVNVNELTLLGSKQDNQAKQEAPIRSKAPSDDLDSDLPF
jgi:single-strand DNA-binding protein